MQSIAEMLQRNPSLTLVLLFGVPSLIWAAAYARRPSRARRRVAIGAFIVSCVLAVVAIVEARRNGASLLPALVCMGVIAASWALAMWLGRREA
ncbi:MAG: hypothetical protein ACXVCV_17770 [Polyangia bacterium]